MGSTTINAKSTGGDVSVTRFGAITNTGTGAANGIDAGTNGVGNASVTNVGAVSLLTNSTGTGIRAAAVNGTATITTNRTVNGGAIGLHGETSGTGAVNVTVNNRIGNLIRPDLVGVQTNAVNGATTVTLNSSVESNAIGVNSITTGTGAITVNGNSNGIVIGAGGDGIHTEATSGVTNITRVAQTIGTTDGIDALSTSGAINITVSADVTGGSDNGIEATSTSGVITVDINGTSTNIGSAVNRAIEIASGAGVATIVNNAGDINGDITGGASNETINNQNDGDWFTTTTNGGFHTSDLGAGTDVVNNQSGADLCAHDQT